MPSRPLATRYNLLSLPVRQQSETPAKGTELPGWIFWGIVGLAALLFFLPVGRRVFYASDEARFAILAQDIVEDGRWVLPRIREGVYLNKPPLFFWTIAAFSLLGGRVTEFTAQLPSALFALLGVIGVGLTGRTLWGDAAGIGSALVLATSVEYFYTAHLVLPDMMLTTGMIWALYFLTKALTDWSHERRWLLLFYAAVGGAVASKGPAGFLPLLPAAALLFMERGRQGLSVRTHPFGFLLLGATILPWLLPYLFQTEADYGEAVIKGDYLNWFFGGAPSSGTWLFPVVSVLGGFLPWTPFLPASFWERGGEPEAWRRRRRWITVWTLTLFVVVGLSAAQRTKYLVPVYPGLALLVGHAMTRWSHASQAGRLRWGMIGWAIIAIGLSGILVIGAAPELRTLVSVFVPATAPERFTASLFLLVGGIGGLLAVYRRRHRAVLPLVGLSTAALLALVAVNYPARQAAASNLKRFALEISPHVGEGSAVAFYRTNNLSFDFYLKRPLKEFQAAEPALQFMARPTPAFLLMEDADWRALNRVAPSTWRVVAEGLVSKRKLLLVGNQS